MDLEPSHLHTRPHPEDLAILPRRYLDSWQDRRYAAVHSAERSLPIPRLASEKTILSLGETHGLQGLVYASTYRRQDAAAKKPTKAKRRKNKGRAGEKDES